MKKPAKTLLLSTLLFFCFSCNKREVQKDLTTPLSVKTILATPKKFQSREIIVIGNIYKVQKEKLKLQLVDLTECTSTCNPVSCIVMTLPVYYGNISIPAVGTNVHVTGKITRKDGKFSFTATKIEPYNER